MRNKTEFEGRVLTLVESDAVAAARRAIAAWAAHEGYLDGDSARVPGGQK